MQLKLFENFKKDNTLNFWRFSEDITSIDIT